MFSYSQPTEGQYFKPLTLDVLQFYGACEDGITEVGLLFPELYTTGIEVTEANLTKIWYANSSVLTWLVQKCPKKSILAEYVAGRYVANRIVYYRAEISKSLAFAVLLWWSHEGWTKLLKYTAEWCEYNNVPYSDFLDPTL